MIESNFSSSESPKSIRFSGSQFQTVVETLHDAAGNGPSGPKPVEQKLSVRAQHACHLLHGLDLANASTRLHQRSRNSPAQKGEI